MKNERRKKFLLIVTVLILIFISQSVFYINTVHANQITKGDTHWNVALVQERLIGLGYYKGRADGILSNKTRNAIKDFQRDNGLDDDGIVGQHTETALGIVLTEANNSGASLDDNCTLLLAKLIFAERPKNAGYSEQVAIGALVLNRVKSADYPKTISGVIYQQGAFKSVDGRLFRRSPDAVAMSAARDAMLGFGNC